MTTMTLEEQVDLAQLLSNAGASCISIDLEPSHSIMIDFSNPQEIAELYKMYNKRDIGGLLIANWSYGKDQIELRVHASDYYTVTKFYRAGLWGDLEYIHEEFLLPELEFQDLYNKDSVKIQLCQYGGKIQGDSITAGLTNSTGDTSYILNVHGFGDIDDPLFWDIGELVSHGSSYYLFDSLYHYGLEIRNIKYTFLG